MELGTLKSVYLLGIGGIGMSALARHFHSLGVKVTGYDKTATGLTAKLEKEGMAIHYEENIDLIPEDTDLVIYTPAIPRDHKEFQYLTGKGIPLNKRSEILGLLTKDHNTIAVAGTHGKTTTSSMLAHIFKVARQDFTAFIGGISKNYNSNYITSHQDPEENVDGHREDLLTSDRISGSPVFIVEADEFDRSFLRLFPHAAIVTSADADHLDIYSGIEDIRQTFGEFVKHIEHNGILIIKEGLNIFPDPDQSLSWFTYSGAGSSPFHARNIRNEGDKTSFDLVTPTEIIRNITLGLPGAFNVENCVAASAISLLYGISPDNLKKALMTFKGVHRRFDFQLYQKDIIYIDDYAHHPEEIRSCIKAVNELFPGKKVTGIFQPHLYSRTRDLADDFARSLELLDEIILLDIYPAREKPIDGITSQFLLKKIRTGNKKLCSKESVLAELMTMKPEILLTLGAGDIDQLVLPITGLFKQHD
ncbi:MAG: Mur ligase family protein [Bacteroidetes bacterium]|nr:Mur ligase family protein [Bacteroidota bacterium]